ncbi:MAG TPA: Rrf2 family transcriptional regulator [Bacteroidia bacterium]|nr:Rrf2 family transcriptional regulator [Bacteroidota bacterium]MBL0054287.1 Rrf2 family transcriptional regulator [Bacteroidota bacterium]HRC32840.1 Rrf2 family transcriptional regulator [Bacteroidia bacterium]
MISKKAKYALKALEYIAKHNEQGPILISEISERQRIPKKFLEVILLELKRDGILQSKMGKNGGYYMLKDPKDVNIGHIIRLIDGPIALLPCVSYKYYEKCAECEDEATCGLRNLMAQVREANNKILNKVSLAEIVKRESMLQKGLTITL